MRPLEPKKGLGAPEWKFGDKIKWRLNHTATSTEDKSGERWVRESYPFEMHLFDGGKDHGGPNPNDPLADWRHHPLFIFACFVLIISIISIGYLGYKIWIEHKRKSLRHIGEYNKIVKKAAELEMK